MAPAYVYIDGFRLYYGALKRTPFQVADLSKLCEVMLPNDTIESIQYFTARVSARPYNQAAPLDQQVYLRALRTIPNLSITFGHFWTHSVRMVLSGSNPPQKVFVDKTEEKGSDVNLAAHLLRDPFLKNLEIAVLITNDSDLAEPARIVRLRSRASGRDTQAARSPQQCAEEPSDILKAHPPGGPDRQPVSANSERCEGRVS